MSQAYSDPELENDPYSLSDIETFQGKDYDDGGALPSDHLEPDKWYYWFCFPGCLPDSDPIGPFDTEDDAIADAQDND